MKASKLGGGLRLSESLLAGPLSMRCVRIVSFVPLGQAPAHVLQEGLDAAGCRGGAG